MYRKPKDQMSIEDFILPFEGKLNKNNRWVQLASTKINMLLCFQRTLGM
jgi:hypothetical protein